MLVALVDRFIDHAKLYNLSTHFCNKPSVRGAATGTQYGIDTGNIDDAFCGSFNKLSGFSEERVTT